MVGAVGGRLHGITHGLMARFQGGRPTRLRWASRWRWWLRRGGARHGLARPLVVSLTSHPPRFAALRWTLMCLLTQSVGADRTILWIAAGDRPQLPPEVLALRSRGLEIASCDDLRSYKKLIPALERCGDCHIVTADDDLYYWPTWLEELVSACRDDARTVPCHRAHRIGLDADGQPLPYARWEFETGSLQPSPLLFPTSGAGVLYPPGSLDAEVTRRDVFLDACPSADDLWLYWMMRRAGWQARCVGRPRPLVTWPGSQDEALWRLNAGANDRQIAALVARYGFPAGTRQ